MLRPVRALLLPLLQLHRDRRRGGCKHWLLLVCPWQLLIHVRYYQLCMAPMNYELPCQYGGCEHS